MARGKQTLVQRIALEGGREIQKELEALGKEGKAAFDALKKAATDTEKAGSRFNKFLVNARQQLDRMGKGAVLVGQGLRDVGSQALTVGRNFAILGAAVGGATFALFKLVQSATQAADEIGKASEAAGVSIEDYTKLQFAFEQGGIGADKFGVVLKTFNNNLLQAQQGLTTYTRVFDALGVTITDASGNIRPLDQLLAEVADSFANMADGAKKSGLATQLFGRAGAKALPLLNTGAAGINALTAQAEKLGLVLDNDARVKAEDFNDSLNALTRSINALKIQFGLLFAPAFTEGFKGLTEIFVENKDALLEIGRTLADTLIPYVQDFFALLTGRDGDVQNQGLISLRDTLLDIGSGVQFVVELIKFLFATLENTIRPIVDLINNVFGTEFETRTIIIIGLVAAATGVFRLLGAVIKAIPLIFEGLAIAFGATAAQGTAIVAAIFALQGALVTLIDYITSGVQSAISGVVDDFKVFIDTLGQFFEDLVDGSINLFQDLLDIIESVIKAATDAIRAVAKAVGLGGASTESNSGSDVRRAGGGPVYGRGTGTSDSILARLSNGEFVLKAAAVRKYGTNFLHYINSGKMPKFALGGLVGSLTDSFNMPTGMPAFADGGEVSSSGRPLTLNIGGETFAGLIAPEDVASRLAQYATGRKVRRAGAKPNWYGGSK